MSEDEPSREAFIKRLENSSFYNQVGGSLVVDLNVALEILEECWQARLSTEGIPEHEEQLRILRKEVARLDDLLKRKDMCAYIGPMRDCPTHGEAKLTPSSIERAARRIAEEWNLNALNLEDPRMEEGDIECTMQILRSEFGGGEK